MLKKIAAGLIATGLFLPLSSCHAYLGPRHEEIHYVDGRGVPTLPKAEGTNEGIMPIEAYAKTHALPTGVSVQKHYKFFFTGGSLQDSFIWFGLLAMLWPLGWEMTAQRFKAERLKAWVDVLSPLLLVGSGYVLMVRTAMGDHFEVGFWTTSAGIWLYAAHGARSCADRLGRWFPALHPWIKSAVLTLVFALGSALPCFMIKGHFFP
jgi:hypothetical protein